jgi:putative aminopeptidase FrvX
MPLLSIDTQYLIDFLTGLLNTPSPTGFTDQAIIYIEDGLSAYPDVKTQRTRKGALLATWAGKSNRAPRAVAVHTDTLGAMVKRIKSNGRLLLTQIGGFTWNSVEGEGCTVYMQNGERLRGSLLIDKASGHVHGKKVRETPREDEHMEVRLDARTSSEQETRDLGVEVGDFVVFDPRVEVTNGFIRSRHLDDKACVACVLAALKAMCEAGHRPAQTTYFYFSNYEEVGHGGASGIPTDSAEMLVVDMAAVGEGQTSDEFHATLCVKDSGGPYHYELNQRLRALAEQHGIPYKVDIYPFYGSDGTAAWRAGSDLAVALIGPGVDASHNYERTHLEALEATTQWIMAYLSAE